MKEAKLVELNVALLRVIRAVWGSQPEWLSLNHLLENYTEIVANLRPNLVASSWAPIKESVS